VNWPSFREYVEKNHSKRSVKDTVNYARKYSRCLLDGDFSKISGFSPAKRRKVLAALSNLSKFLGKYETFRELMKDYGLKWESVKVEELLISRLTRTEKNGSVLEWVNTVKERFPRLRVFLDFVAVSGLRFVEAVESYDLTIDLSQHDKLNSYYDREKEVLEHFRFKQIFIRNNKKAFVSFIPWELIRRIGRMREKLTTSLVYDLIKRNSVRPRFNELREYYATYMTRYLSQPEIDFLQGRVSGSVFMRNYFNPALISDLKTRVFKGIEDLRLLD
jgi:intergrase/recombinase